MSAFRTLKLSEADTVRFIELYQNEPLLFDTTMSQYRDRDLRAAAVKRIADALNVRGFGPSEVIVKFKNLRNAYSQELKKIAHSRRSGCSADEVYCPKVCWFSKMNSFLRPFVQQRATHENLVSTLIKIPKITQVKRSVNPAENLICISESYN
jgi:hypothetical protein